MKLYELSAEWEALAVELADAEEITDEMEQRLTQLDGDIREKVQAICCLVRRFTLEAKAASEEASRLTHLASHRHATAEKLKDYLEDHLQRMGLQRIETDLFKVRVQRNSVPTIRWTGDGDIPEPFRRVATSLNGTAILEAWKAGKLPEGFTAEIGTHLRIS